MDYLDGWKPFDEIESSGDSGRTWKPFHTIREFGEAETGVDLIDRHRAGTVRYRITRNGLTVCG